MARLRALEADGSFRPGMAAWQAGVAGWLLAAEQIFQGRPEASGPWMSGAALALAAILWAAGCHRTLPPPGWRRLPLAWAGAALIHLLLTAALSDHVSLAASAWFGGLLAVIAFTGQRVLARLPAAASASAEAMRWLTLAGAALWLFFPYHDNRPSGSGDAMWYKFMLADFILQVRSAGLPVWTGQTEFAFNGALIPLRLAPWYQHAGALVDLLTGRALEYVALNNLVLVLAALAAAFSAYGCCRALLPRQPWLATLTGFIYLASPGVLGPLMAGDQYMTFMAAPLLPPAGLALWRLGTRDKTRDLALLAAVLAASWLTHPPTGLCLGFLAGLTIAAAATGRRRLPLRSMVVAAAAFAILGSFPFVSSLSLAGSPVDPTLNTQAALLNRDNFPAILLPLPAPPGEGARAYQPGYAAILLGGMGAVAFLRRRTLAAGIFLALIALVAVLVLPVPGVTTFLWRQVPGLAMQVLNTWTLHRFAGIGTILLIILGAGTLAGWTDRRPRLAGGLLTLVAVAAMWAGWQAHFLTAGRRLPAERDEVWRSTYDPANLVLARYSFNGFPVVPSYFSHGYIDPLLEHRLLKRDRTVLATNAESAVRHGALPAPDPAGTARLAHGTWRAVNDNQTTYYNLDPAFVLPARQRLALWLEPLDPGQPGWIQLGSQDLFREYLLPDSGIGSVGRPAPRGFGTLPESSHVISLFTRKDRARVRAINIAPERAARTDFDFARFELWRYDPADLPVVVRSWVPYQLVVRSPEPAYVDTPRVWLPEYRATVNGQRVAVERSPDNTAMFAVPAGYSEVSIKYVPSLALEASYWLTLGGWLALAAAGLVWLGRPVPLISVASPRTGPA